MNAPAPDEHGRSVSLERLLEHLQWADRQVLGALRGAPPEPAALELFAHVVGAEETWLSRLEGRMPRAAVWPRLTLEETAALAEQVHAGLAEWLARAGEDVLAAEITYTNSAGLEFTSRAADIWLHVVLHGTYHRGQIALLLRQDGAAPAPTDYIAWVRGVPAATRADSA